MRTEEEIKTFYATKIYPGIENMEVRRRTLAARLKKANYLILIVWAAWIILSLCLFRGDDLLEALYYSIMPALILFGMSHHYLTGDYLTILKKHIVGPLVQFLTPSLRYEPQGKVPKHMFVYSQLYPYELTGYEGQNLVSGRIGDTDIQFSEIKARTRKPGYIGKIGKTPSDKEFTCFQGLFVVADFNKLFRNRVFVLPQLLGPLDELYEALRFDRPPLETLDNPEFEKEFIVFGDDPIETRYILSPGLMERLTALSQKTKSSTAFSFVYGRLFIAIYGFYPLFNPSVSESLLDINIIKEYCDILQSALDVVDDLNLNTRIWSKK